MSNSIFRALSHNRRNLRRAKNKQRPLPYFNKLIFLDCHDVTQSRMPPTVRTRNGSRLGTRPTGEPVLRRDRGTTSLLTLLPGSTTLREHHNGVRHLKSPCRVVTKLEWSRCSSSVTFRASDV